MELLLNISCNDWFDGLIAERGPQPERSPVMARFNARNGGTASISVLRRNGAAIKQTLLQVRGCRAGNSVGVRRV